MLEILPLDRPPPLFIFPFPPPSAPLSKMKYGSRGRAASTFDVVVLDFEPSLAQVF